MRRLLWPLPALFLACSLQAQPRSELPDPVAYPADRWVDLGEWGRQDLAADREALSVQGRERGLWVRLHGIEHRGSSGGLFIYSYYTIDCEGGRSKYHMRLYVFDGIVHNSTGMGAEWEPIEPGSVPSRLCMFDKPKEQPQTPAQGAPFTAGAA